MCLQYCPTKYIVDATKTRCEYEGLVCPDGFYINPRKDGCIPLTFDCDPGYIINDAEDACVPAPGSPVPFPFLIIAVFICNVVLGSYLKDKFYTKVVTNLICLLGCLEVVMYVMMVIYALIMDEWWIMIFCCLGLAFLLVTNIIFLVFYKQEIIGKD